MAEILFIKTSSLGDVVHHMPAVSDARRHLPGARLSWVVEEAYAPLARLHPGVDAGAFRPDPGGRQAVRDRYGVARRFRR